METFNIWDSDYRFMQIIWAHAPVPSGQLVDLSRQQLGWKKSTTYNAIRRLCEKGLIKNERAVVTVLVPQEQVQAEESHAFLERTFNGSLPRFLAAFLNGKAISTEEAREIQRLIDAHQEGRDQDD